MSLHLVMSNTDLYLLLNLKKRPEFCRKLYSLCVSPHVTVSLKANMHKELLPGFN